MSHKLISSNVKHKITIKTMHFLGVGELITSLYIVYDYTTR